ncbi:MAG: hypothetical protein GX442_15365 [Candidatus Riflebacteria bacterium]|nr:hypothetical protein [Candidatus Riflebacteria bacterium]
MNHLAIWRRGCCVLGLVLGLVLATPAGAADPGAVAGTVAADPPAADTQVTDPLAALLAYVEDNRPPEHRPGTVREMGPDKYLRHPYAAKSLTRRMMAILQNPAGPAPDPATALIDEIRDAKRVESVLANPGEGKDRLRALAEIHPITILSREEFDVLGDIVREMVRAGYAREQVTGVIGLIRELEPFLHMNPDFPTISSRLLEVERACLLARHKKADPAQVKAVLALLADDPFDRDTLYGGACLLALTGQPEPARDLLARLSLLDSGIAEKVGGDPDLATLRQDKDWLDRLVAGKARPVLKPAPNPGIASLTLRYHWGGMGKAVDETRTLTWKQDRYVDPEGSTEVPAGLIQLLLKGLADARPSDSLQSRITHFDDYPSLKVTLERTDGGKTILFSSSNTAGMLPFNIAGPQGLQVTNARLVGQVLHYLLNWLGVTRGSPMASYHFGGTEIPKGDRRQPVSAEEAQFRKEGGLPEQPAPAAPEPLPPELTALPGSATHLMGSYVVDRHGNPAVEVDRYMAGPRPGEPGCAVSLVRVRRAGQTAWYPEPPAAFLAHAAEAWERLQKALGPAITEGQVRPWVRSVDDEGFPSGMDLVESLGLASRLGVELAALGPTPVRTEILARGKGNLQFEGWLLLASGTIYSDDFEFTAPPLDHPLATQLLTWAGIGKEQVPAVKSLMLRNNMAYVDLVASPTATDVEAMKKGIAAAGRTLEEVEKHIAPTRWLVKPAAGESLHVLIGPDGLAEFRSRPK